METVSRRRSSMSRPYCVKGAVLVNRVRTRRWVMDEPRGWFFPELSNSYKTVLVAQIFACYVLVIVIGVTTESWMWAAVAWAVDTLKDCFVVTAMIQASRANAISEETQRKLQERRSSANVLEGRLLSREEMSAPPPTLELPPGSEDKW